jgi:hypothetical protein
MGKMISGEILARKEGSLSCGQAPRPQENGVEHRRRENPGEGVLLGGVVTAEEGYDPRRRLGPVGEPGFRTKLEDAQRCVPGEGAEADHDPGVEQLELVGGVGKAGIALLRGGLILRRGAADGGRDPEPFETEAVFAVARDGFVRETRAVEGGEEEVTRAVAGEEAAGPVGAVGGGGEAEDDDPCRWVAEAGDRTAPVGLTGVSGPFLAGYFFSPLHEPRAAAAGDDLTLQRGELLLSGVDLLTRRSG